MQADEFCLVSTTCLIQQNYMDYHYSFSLMILGSFHVGERLGTQNYSGVCATTATYKANFSLKEKTEKTKQNRSTWTSKDAATFKEKHHNIYGKKWRTCILCLFCITRQENMKRKRIWWVYFATSANPVFFFSLFYNQRELSHFTYPFQYSENKL